MREAVSPPLSHFPQSYVTAHVLLYYASAAVLMATLAFNQELDRRSAIAATALFGVTAALLFILWLQPAIVLDAKHLTIGHRTIPWSDIRSVERALWLSPLVLRITLSDGSSIRLVHPGKPDSCRRLMQSILHFVPSSSPNPT